MKRWVFSFLAGLVVLAGVTVAIDGTADAQDGRTATVSVAFSPGDREDGESCGTRSQVIVTDAAGVIVGKLDLAHPDHSVRGDAPMPGTVADGLCRVSGDIALPDSAYYTFAVEGHYQWTFSAPEMDDRGNVVEFAWIVF